MTKRSAALGLAAAMLASAAPAQTSAPRLLAPGIVSTGDIEFSPALTPDGQTLYFTKGSPGHEARHVDRRLASPERFVDDA